jgi:hypothetical protein
MSASTSGADVLAASSIPWEKSKPTGRWPAAASSRQRSPVPHARSRTREPGGSASSRTVRRLHPASMPNVITRFTRS